MHLHIYNSDAYESFSLNKNKSKNRTVVIQNNVKLLSIENEYRIIQSNKIAKDIYDEPKNKIYNLWCSNNTTIRKITIEDDRQWFYF